MLSLTATELPRFMACNGSRLMGGLKPFHEDMTVADEGNAADWLISQVFYGHHMPEELIDRKSPSGIYITPEMVEHCMQYLADIHGEGHVEIDTSYGIPGIFEVRGRADWAALTNDGLVIRDFKYGWKIVEPEENWTLISHAVGYISKHGLNVDRISLEIYQPRPFHPDGPVRKWVINHDQLMKHWERLRHTLENPSDQVVSGPQCYKCPSLSQCPAAQVASMGAVEVAYGAFDSEIDNTNLSFMLDTLDRAQEVLKQSLSAYEDLALHRLRVGQYVPEYTAQQGYSQTRWKTDACPDLIMALTGINVTEPKIISPAQAKKAGVPEPVVIAYTERIPAGFKLVRQDLNKKAEKLLTPTTKGK